jgi:hypothetical protein
MYTQQTGRKFLEFYNKKTGKNFSASEFFEEEFFPVLFDAEDHLHLLQVTNSKFFQKISKDDQREDVRDSVIKKERFLNDVKEVSNGEKTISGAVAVGFMAGDIDKSTSGQISSIDFDLSEENILYSWFGGALGVGFGGGYDFLFNNEELLWFLFEGWKFYRKYLDETPKAKGRQIATWNGLWITHGLEFKDNLDKAYKNTLDLITGNSGKDKGKIKLNRPAWSDQVFSLAKFLDTEHVRELVYGYKLSQMNSTLGFMYIDLGKVRWMPQIFEQLIKQDSKISRRQATKLEEVYKTQFSIEKACSLGGIGVRALKPKDLYKYTGGDVRKRSKKMYKLDKEEKRITFITYITWIQAMLNNEDTLQLSEEVAEALLKFEGEENRLRTRIKQVESLWETRNRQQFIEGLSSIIEEDKNTAELLNKAVEKLMTSIPQDMFKLFLTLIKFKYNYYQSN